MTRPVHEDALAMLRPRAEVVVGPEDPPIPSQDEVARLIKDADICYTLAANPVTAAAIGGPPLALVYQRAEAATLRATLALVFAVGSLLSLGALEIAGQLSAREVWTGVAMLPFFLVGFLMSLGLRERLSGQLFRVAVLVVVTGSALALLARHLLL